VGTNEAVQFVAPTFLQRVCTLLQDPVAGECAYGKTVWSWPSLLRSSCRGGAGRPTGL